MNKKLSIAQQKSDGTYQRNLDIYYRIKSGQCTFADIVKETGLSRQRIHQIVNNKRRELDNG